VSATGPQPDNFENIGSATGVYAISPTTATSQVGEYTIQVMALTLDGVFYTNASPELVSPSSFTLTVVALGGCDSTIVTSQTVSAITL